MSGHLMLKKSVLLSGMILM